MAPGHSESQELVGAALVDCVLDRDKGGPTKSSEWVSSDFTAHRLCLLVVQQYLESPCFALWQR